MTKDSVDCPQCGKKISFDRGMDACINALKCKNCGSVVELRTESGGCICCSPKEKIHAELMTGATP